MAMTNYLILWETVDGKRHWEAVEKEQTHDFLIKLLESGAVPASIMAGYSPIFFHWVFPRYHNGLSDVRFATVNKEIMGHEPVQESRHAPVAAKRTETAGYGWLARDGRFFPCGYGEHIAIANRIVGGLEPVSNAEAHLETFGWAKISRDQSPGGKAYAVYMAPGKKLSDEQFKTLQRLGLDSAGGITQYL